MRSLYSTDSTRGAATTSSGLCRIPPNGHPAAGGEEEGRLKGIRTGPQSISSSHRVHQRISIGRHIHNFPHQCLQWTTQWRRTIEQITINTIKQERGRGRGRRGFHPLVWMQAPHPPCERPFQQQSLCNIDKVNGKLPIRRVTIIPPRNCEEAAESEDIAAEWRDTLGRRNGDSRKEAVMGWVEV